MRALKAGRGPCWLAPRVGGDLAGRPVTSSTSLGTRDNDEAALKMITRGGSTQQNPRLPVGVNERWLSRYPPPASACSDQSLVSGLSRPWVLFCALSGQCADCLKQHHFQPGSVSEDGLWGEALEKGPPEACGLASGSPRPRDLAWRGLPAPGPLTSGPPGRLWACSWPGSPG